MKTNEQLQAIIDKQSEYIEFLEYWASSDDYYDKDKGRTLREEISKLKS